MNDKITDAAKTSHFWLSIFLGGAVAAMLAGMAISSYTGSFARASTVEKIEIKQQAQAEDIASLKGIIPFVRATFEIERSEQYRRYRIVIPDPAAPDAGMNKGQK